MFFKGGFLLARFVLGIVFCLVLSLNLASANQSPVILTLEQALKTALENHPTLAEGRAGVEIQQGAQAQSRSLLLPQINYTTTYQRANSRGSVFGASQAFTNYSSLFSLNQLIYDFGRTPELLRASHERVIAARETLQYDRQQVLFGVYQAYYQLLEAKANLKVQHDNIKDLQDHLGQAKSFFEVGTRPKIDLTQAESNLSTGELALVQAENSFAISETNLKVAMGTPDLPLFEVTEELAQPLDYSISLPPAVQEAYLHRPDLLALMAQELGAQASLLSAQKSYFPTITGSAQSGQIGPTYYPPQDTWNLGIQLNFSIFNGFLTSGEIQQAKGNFHQIAAEVDALRLAIRQAVEQAYDNMTAAKASVKVARDGLRYATENFELADGRYRTGVGDYLQYTDAKVGYLQAEANLIQALGNYNIAIASVKQAMGILEEH